MNCSDRYTEGSLYLHYARRTKIEMTTESSDRYTEGPLYFRHKS